jgi:tRNA1Val (adenine37-N6)-methyltransferase
MKVGTDGVLLGAWATVEGAKNILDIGTGSGLIALMLAQRTSPDACIDAVELGESDVGQAKENVGQSPWPEKIIVHHTAIQNYTTVKKYDLIVTNPPYFLNSLAPPSDRRKEARHTATLSYQDLLDAVTRLLSDTGTFSVILPTIEGNIFQSLAITHGLYCSRQTAFFSRAEKPQERWLIEFTRTPLIPVADTIVLYERLEEWTKRYAQLTRDFYLS